MTGLQPDEPDHGSGGARGGARRSTVRPKRRRPWRPRRRAAGAADARGAAARCAPTFRFRRRRIWTARCATCRTWPRSGATSIRSCSTAGTSATRATSKRSWRSTMPKALELFHNMEEVKQEAARFMKVKAVWQFFEAERDGNAIHLFAPGGDDADPHVPVRPAAPRGRPVPQRLHSGRRRRPARPPGAVRRDRRRRRPRAVRGVEAGGRVLQGARDSRRWRSKPPKAAPSGCTAAFARIGASPIRRR